MGLIVLPWEGLVGRPYVPGPCAWPMVGFLKGGVEREGPDVCVCMCACAYMRVHVCAHLCVCVCVCVCAYVYVCACICVCEYARK